MHSTTEKGKSTCHSPTPSEVVLQSIRSLDVHNVRKVEIQSHAQTRLIVVDRRLERRCSGMERSPLALL